MPATLLIGPAACGKTQAVLAIARDAARALAAQPVICVPTTVQRNHATRRVGELGGALGVRVLTFDALYSAILAGAPFTYVELAEAVQYRLMRDVIESLARRRWPGALCAYRRHAGLHRKGAQPDCRAQGRAH